jgi:hypothetical protein
MPMPRSLLCGTLINLLLKHAQANPVGSDEIRKTFLDNRRNILESSNPGWSRHGESVQFASHNEVNDRKRRDKYMV